MMSMSEACQMEAACAIGMSASCLANSTVQQVSQEATIELSRAQIEQLVTETFAGSIDGRRLQRLDGAKDTSQIDPGTYGLESQPTVEEMLVPGSPANNFLAALFTAEQQPHLVLPISIELAMSGGGGHRRQLQRTDGTIDRVLISMKAVAPTVEESESSLARVIELQTTGRRL